MGNRSTNGGRVKAGPLTIRQAVEVFLQGELTGESAQTRRWYADRLGSLCTALGPGRPAAEVQAGDLQEWLAGLQGPPVRQLRQAQASTYTRYSCLRAARRLFRWLQRQGLAAENPAKELHPPKRELGKSHGLCQEERRAILAAARWQPCDHAILHLLAESGCRPQALAALRLEDLHSDPASPGQVSRVRLCEKGQKERVIALSPAARKALGAWLAARPACAARQVFLVRPPGGAWGPLKASNIYRLIKKYAWRAGVRGKCAPRYWRQLLDRGDQAAEGLPG